MILKVSEFDGLPSDGEVVFSWNDESPCARLVNVDQAIKFIHENMDIKYGGVIKRKHSIKGFSDEGTKFEINDFVFTGGMSANEEGLSLSGIGYLELINSSINFYGIEIPELWFDAFSRYKDEYKGEKVTYLFNCTSFSINGISYDLFHRDGQTFIVKLDGTQISDNESNAIGTVFSIVFGTLFKVNSIVGLDEKMSVVYRKDLCDLNKSIPSRHTFAQKKRTDASEILAIAFNEFELKNEKFDIVRASSIFYHAMNLPLVMRFAQMSIAFDTIAGTVARYEGTNQVYFSQEAFSDVEKDLFRIIEKKFPDIVEANIDAIKGKIHALNCKSMADKLGILENTLGVSFSDAEKNTLKKRNPAVHSGFITKTDDFEKDLGEVVSLERIMVKLFSHILNVSEYICFE